jgi:hypothetical protein
MNTSTSGTPIEAAEKDDRALGLPGGETVARQNTSGAVAGIRHFMASELIESVHQTHCAQKSIPRVAPFRIIDAQEKVGGSIVETRPENMAASRRLISIKAGQKVHFDRRGVGAQ